MSAVGDLVRSQWYIFLVALLVGVGLCFLYDLFRVVRRVIPHSLPAVTVEDFLFWIFWTLTVMTMLDRLDRGVIRGFSLGAVFLGMLLYLLCFSKIVCKVLTFILGKIWKALTFVLGKLYRALRAVGKTLIWPWKKIVVFFHRRLRYNREKSEVSGEPHGKENARHREQKQKKEKFHRKDHHL